MLWATLKAFSHPGKETSSGIGGMGVFSEKWNLRWWTTWGRAAMGSCETLLPLCA